MGKHFHEEYIYIFIMNKALSNYLHIFLKYVINTVSRICSYVPQIFSFSTLPLLLYISLSQSLLSMHINLPPLSFTLKSHFNLSLCKVIRHSGSEHFRFFKWKLLKTPWGKQNENCQIKLYRKLQCWVKLPQVVTLTVNLFKIVQRNK